MKLRTVEDLFDSLSSEMAWRKKELSALRAAIVSAKSSNALHRALLRAGVALLYAHWEGFVRRAACDYVEYVSHQQLKYEQLEVSFVVLGARRMLRDAEATERIAKHREVVTFLRTGVQQVAKISAKGFRKSLDRLGNLRWELAEDVLSSIGIDVSDLATKRVLVDERLLRSRNEIAHGDHRAVTEKEFIELHDAVLALLEQVRSRIDNAASQGLYRAA